MILIIIRLFPLCKHIQLHIWLLLYSICFLQIHRIWFLYHFTNSINLRLYFIFCWYLFIILTWSRHTLFRSIIYESSLCWSKHASLSSWSRIHLMYKSRSHILTWAWSSIFICWVIKSLFFAQKALIIITIKPNITASTIDLQLI